MSAMVKYSAYHGADNERSMQVKSMCGAILAAVAFAALAGRAGIVVYPEYDSRIERDHAYAVRVVQGEDRKFVAVYNHCEKSSLERRTRGGNAG